MFLEEKQLPYKVKKVPLLAYGEKPEWFLNIAPTGLLPVRRPWVFKLTLEVHIRTEREGYLP